MYPLFPLREVLSTSINIYLPLRNSKKKKKKNNNEEII